jgi:heme A synthase
MSIETSARAATKARFRRLVLLACAATYALIVVGGVVRATGSGDACPDWPRCHGQLLPPLETDVMIEFSHRLVASVVGFLVAGTALAAYRWQRSSPVTLWGSFAAVGLVIGQIILGGVTVLNDLSAGLVMAHLAMAATLLAVLLTIAIVSSDAQLPPVTASMRNLTLLAALATLALMLTGSYVSGSGAGLAFRDWPLLNGSLMPGGERLAVIHATHRFAAGAVGLLIAYVAWQAWRTHRVHVALVASTSLALVIYVAQVFVGAANIWTLLQPSAVATHLALAVALWGALVSATVLAQLSLRREAAVREPPAARETRGQERAASLPAREPS